MKHIRCQAALLALALSLAACSDRPRTGSGPTGEGKPQPPIETLQEMGAAIRLDAEGHVIVVQIRDGQATDATAKLLVAMESLKDLQLSGEQVTGRSRCGE